MKRINRFFERTLPVPIWIRLLKFKYKFVGRPLVQGETSKAKSRRIKEGFFEKYCQGYGLDIGYGGDVLCLNCKGWDFEHGDAQYMAGVKDSEFDFVYSSHVLEHLHDPASALKNWWRVLKPGGYLILYIPHRDLYEKKATLPSRWNSDHKHFFLLERDDPPDTIGIMPLVQHCLKGLQVVYAKVCDEGHTMHDPKVHSDGEYSIEAVIMKQGDAT